MAVTCDLVPHSQPRPQSPRQIPNQMWAAKNLMKARIVEYYVTHLIFAKSLNFFCQIKSNKMPYSIPGNVQRSSRIEVFFTASGRVFVGRYFEFRFLNEDLS